MKRIIDSPGAAPTLFPPPDFSAYLVYIRAVWDDARATLPTWWTAKLETTLVAGFFVMLNNDQRRMDSGMVFGHFMIENPEFIIDPRTGMPKTIGRTDIKFGHLTPMGPVLTMEFKRLNNRTALRQKYFTQGVARFVEGKYSRAEDTAIMVGLVDGCSIIEKTGLLSYLRRNASRIKYKLQPMTHPEYGDPSQDAPSVEFDTLHDREPGCLSPQIRLGHMLLLR